MQPTARSSFQPIAAGGVLLGTVVLFAAVGGLLGLAAGSLGIGILVGAIVGIPAGAYAVYRRYRGFFT